MITHTTQEPREEQVGSSWSSPCIFHFVDVCLKYIITIISIDNSLIYRYSDACSMYNLHSLNEKCSVNNSSEQRRGSADFARGKKCGG